MSEQPIAPVDAVIREPEQLLDTLRQVADRLDNDRVTVDRMFTFTVTANSFTVCHAFASAPVIARAAADSFAFLLAHLTLPNQTVVRVRLDAGGDRFLP